VPTQDTTNPRPEKGPNDILSTPRCVTCAAQLLRERDVLTAALSFAKAVLAELARANPRGRKAACARDQLDRILARVLEGRS
jgi:hypothetical protein